MDIQNCYAAGSAQKTMYILVRARRPGWVSRRKTPEDLKICDWKMSMGRQDFRNESQKREYGLCEYGFDFTSSVPAEVEGKYLWILVINASADPFVSFHFDAK